MAQHCRDRVGHSRRIGDRRQLEKPDTIRKLIHQIGRDFQRQARLAHPAHPDQCDEPMGAQCTVEQLMRGHGWQGIEQLRRGSAGSP